MDATLSDVLACGQPTSAPLPNNRHLLLVSWLAPRPGTGSTIVLYRHLERLEKAGWTITLVIPEHELQWTVPLQAAWRVVVLPRTRRHWPPFRLGSRLLTRIRLKLLKALLLNQLQAVGCTLPDVCLTLLYGPFSELAADTAQWLDIPLYVLMHDQEELWHEPQNRGVVLQRIRRVARMATALLPVSEQLAASYGALTSSKSEVLLPMPDDRAAHRSFWRATHATEPVVIHAGSLHPFQWANMLSVADSLNSLNGILVLVAAGDNVTAARLCQARANIRWQRMFVRNEDLLTFIRKKATALLVSYSFDEQQQPWARTSFPSKFLDYAQSGLPVIILAPAYSAISKWARENDWLGYAESLDPNKLYTLLSCLIDSEEWERLANQTHTSAISQFCASRIHKQLVERLSRQVQGYARSNKSHAA